MEILHDRLAVVARLKPSWEKRLIRLLDASNRLTATLRVPYTASIHRDFYSDQVLVDGERVYLLDLDLICQGDPALDIGNFSAHISEYSLRVLGNPSTLADRERALEDRFVELKGDAARERVRAYALLTLVRHIYLSTQFPERQAFTQDILELCEQRFSQIFK
jgi:aminoglycoside phosphotransferase (APT) family kinase protein